MRCRYFVILVSTALFLLPNTVWSQTQSTDSTLAVRELWTRRSNDGRSHAIEAIALGRSGHANVIYVIERDSEPGSGKSKDGDYLLWKLDEGGKVLHREFIKKVSGPEPAFATILPLPPPQEGMIITGMFELDFCKLGQA